jgi:hypothetical protein
MKKKANEMAAAFKTSFSTETSGMGEKAKTLTKFLGAQSLSLSQLLHQLITPFL